MRSIWQNIDEDLVKFKFNNFKNIQYLTLADMSFDDKIDQLKFVQKFNFKIDTIWIDTENESELDEILKSLITTINHLMLTLSENYVLSDNVIERINWILPNDLFWSIQDSRNRDWITFYKNIINILIKLDCKTLDFYILDSYNWELTFVNPIFNVFSPTNKNLKFKWWLFKWCSSIKNIKVV